MKTRYILMAAAALVVSACAKTNEQPEPEGMQITLHAYQEGAHTKTTVQDGGTQVFWEPSDEIKVFFKGSGSRFISQNTEAATVADFSGTLNILVGANEGASSTTKIFGLYPYRADATSDGSSVTTTLPAEQTGRAGSFAKNTHISLAATNANSVDLGFYNVTGGLRFSLTQEGIKSVTFEGNNGETLAGKIKLAFEGGVPVVKGVSEGETVLTLTAPGGGTFQTGQWYYIEAIPGTLSNGFKMVFSKGSETAKVSSSGSVTISRGRYGSLADADEGLIFKESGGDEPNPSSVIQFADPIAKYACVEKFDTDGDGEVSFEEAAAVSSLEGLFKEWNTVTSFDEIKYFTNATSTKNAFNGCSKLTRITIPNNIKTLGTFQDCTSLTTVVLPVGLSSLPSNCFDGCASLKDITLPESISSIPQYCFHYCSSLVHLNIPSSVTSMGQYAFSGCKALDSITLPSDITAIPDHCFEGCNMLSSITWPFALESIGDRAFYDCLFKANNYTIVLPNTIKSIGSEAFFALHHIVIPSTTAVSIQSDSFCGSYSILYVPANMVETYKVRSNWSAYSDLIYALDEYPIVLTVGGVEGEAVDLGLSVRWASWNLGASSPEDYGNYFAWGETEPKWDYSWSTYKWCNGSELFITKYCIDNSYWAGVGSKDNKKTLDAEDDAAHVKWGGSWRIPTKEEWSELGENCTWSLTSVNGINGYLVTSNKPGYTDRSIFLPATGERHESYFLFYNTNEYGLYWSSTLYGRSISAWAYYVNSSGHDFSYDRRRKEGYSVRPVCPKE